jgi:hypothetical protein
MPVYEFRCHACGKAFQIVESVKDYDPRNDMRKLAGGAGLERDTSGDLEEELSREVLFRVQVAPTPGRSWYP